LAAAKLEQPFFVEIFCEMSASSDDLYRNFLRQIQKSAWTLKNINAAYQRNYIVRRDVGQAYEAIFLQAVVSFELFVEDLFLGLATNSVTHPRPCVPHVTFPSVDIARRIVGRGRYIDWLPLSRTLEKAKIFFDDAGNPFPCLSGVQLEEVERTLLIRNVIAHKSTHAYAAFQRKVVSGLMLPPRKRDLLGYLQYPHTANATKYDYHIGELSRAAFLLSH
jgi:hypothetical protein